MKVLNTDRMKDVVFMELNPQSLTYLRLACLQSAKEEASSSRVDHGIKGETGCVYWKPKKRGFVATRADGKTKFFKANAGDEEQLSSAREHAKQWALEPHSEDEE